MNPPRIQLFSVEEYERRLQGVRDLMTQKTLDVILVHAPDSLYYLTGYQTPRDYCHQALILPIDSEPVFIASPHEASLIPARCWVDDVRIYPDTSDWADVTSNLLKELGFSSANIGLETKSWALNVDLRDRISGQMPDAAMFDGSGLVESCQLIKSPEEQVFLRKAARFSELGMQAGIAAVRERATELDVTIAVHTALDLAGSEYRGHPSIIQSGDGLSSRYRKWSRKK